MPPPPHQPPNNTTTMPAPPTATTSPSWFLQLPPELRNMIYAHVFDSLTITPCPCITRSGHCRYCVFYSSPQQQQQQQSPPSSPASSSPAPSSPKPQRQLPFHSGTGLTQTCRQIRAETRLLPFKYATYRMKCVDHFARWYSELDGELREAVWEGLNGWQRYGMEWAQDKGVLKGVRKKLE
ncbi:hypothetical protein E8E13_008261 [Curvularia kusanoi]|uniref:2EXR domain-containing protein n=1 Tax=Curvularia kusanoi TaxID=90978 RepID=A0A9P4TDF5_CURKU|nr:hypothetical protein E8E13_008261 [Curvularia kusanoi]